MYYIYHIKGVKWGCTKRLEQRLKEQRYSISDLDRLITVSNVDKAAEMEEKLNLEYGYKWDDSQNYKHITKVSFGHWLKENGRKQGKRNVETGHIFTITNKELQSKAGKIGISKMSLKDKSKGGKIGGNIVGNLLHQCPHCNKSIKGRVYFRWHGDNCKQKK